MFFKKQKNEIEWLVVGLGNPGRKFEKTRHNVGFDALDVAAGKWGIDVRRSKFDGLYGQGNVGGAKVALLKPQTYMNLSGTSVQKAASFYRVAAQRILVLCDDVSLAPGVIRIRLSGSAGGHNGLKSIITFMGEEFPRIKIGVREKPRPGYDLADWVTGRPSAADAKLIAARYNEIAAAMELLFKGETSEAMALYNGEGRK
jgi:PTH1 family peptidyl-tRNA hydrolase